VELKTFEWICRFNHRPLHSSIGDVPPVEFEAAYYHQRWPELLRQTPKLQSLHETRADSHREGR